jgi:glycosyltransferase involved in cell wall biosynthesis
VTHAVFVTPNIDAVPQTGATIRTHRFVRALASALPVDVIALREPVDEAALAAVTGARSVRCFPSDSPAAVKRAVALGHRWPIDWARTWDRRAAAAVREAGASGVVVLDHVHTYPYRPRYGRFVLSTHNIEAPLAAEMPMPRPLGRRVERLWDLATWPSREQEAFGDPRAEVVVVSDVDARRSGRRAVVVENGTDVPLDPPPPPFGGALLFIGSLDYLPNRAAIEWWVEHVIPHLPSDVPPLRVVGRGGELLPHLARHPRVELVGAVAEVGPELAAASVAVIPLQHGGGTRLKLLEALAWRRPVVTTTKGAEGIPVEHGRQVLIADDGPDFAVAVDRAWRNRQLAAQLARDGRALAERYDWTRLAGRFVDVVTAVAGVR